MLFCAIGAEVVATSLLPRTAGFTAPVPSVAVLGGYGLSFFLPAQVVKSVPVGVAYATWSGVGTLAVVSIGALFLGQRISGWPGAGVVLVVLGVLGVVLLNLGGRTH